MDGSVNPMLLNWKFWPAMGLLFLAAMVLVRGEDSERVYSLAEVAVIDRENKMLRRVDATESVEANVQRLLAAGFPPADVEELKPRLVEMWGEIDPWLQFEWLDQKTVARIQELKQEYTIPMRSARLRESTYRLGGEHEPVTPGQVNTRWRTAIWQLLGLDEREEFTLMNSAPALVLFEQTRELSLTVDEKRTLCLWQQDYHRAIREIMARQSGPDRMKVAGRMEALLAYWQRMRGLLRDDRFAAYLQTADAGFGRMAGVLKQIDEITSSNVLDLWWIRKNDELADVRMIFGNARQQMNIKAHESAADILGRGVLGSYEKNDEAKWLERLHPDQVRIVERN